MKPQSQPSASNSPVIARHVAPKAVSAERIAWLKEQQAKLEALKKEGK